MIIEGKKNLELLKGALETYKFHCSLEAIRADDKKAKEIWDPRIAEIKTMLDAIEINLRQFKEETITGPTGRVLREG